jgi:hypothetical protein
MNPCRTVREWNSTADERAAAWPCDGLIADPDLIVFRAVDVDANPDVVFRWLCQLRVAPYSYDWIDNLGRRSPQHLTPGLDELEVGQRIATIFELVAFEPNVHITLRSCRSLFGDVAGTYRVALDDKGGSRLAVKLVVRHRRDPLGLLWSLVLPAGDLVMMRKQLHTLARLAERDSTDSSPEHR